MSEPTDSLLSPEATQKLINFRDQANSEIEADKKLLSHIKAHYKTVSIERLQGLYKSRALKNIALRDQLYEIGLILRQYHTDWKSDLLLGTGIDYNNQKRKEIEEFETYAGIYPKWVLYQMWKKQVAYTSEIYGNLYECLIEKACIECLIEKKKKEQSKE